MGLLGLSPATGLLGDCPCCNQVAKADDLWGYGQNWEGVCATGQFQSPIDIPIRNSEYSRFFSRGFPELQLELPDE